jgi:hypothetical protein
VQNFTKILVDDVIKVIRELTDEDTTKLVKVCLKSTYFSFFGYLYEQIEGVGMGSPLSPGVAKLFMEKFEIQTIDSFPQKLKIWKIYLYDKYVFGPHRSESLTRLFNHLNSQSEIIEFTMELEENENIPFLYVLISKKNNCFLSHQVY